MQLFSGLACFSPSVSPTTRKLWDVHGGTIATTLGQKKTSDWYFCDGPSDPWLVELLKESIIVFHAKWVIDTSSAKFSFPLTGYVLDFYAPCTTSVPLAISGSEKRLAISLDPAQAAAATEAENGNEEQMKEEMLKYTERDKLLTSTRPTSLRSVIIKTSPSRSCREEALALHSMSTSLVDKKAGISKRRSMQHIEQFDLAKAKILSKTRGNNTQSHANPISSIKFRGIRRASRPIKYIKNITNAWPFLIVGSSHDGKEMLRDEIPSVSVADFLSLSRHNGTIIDEATLFTLGSEHLGKQFKADDNTDRRKTI